MVRVMLLLMLASGAAKAGEGVEVLADPGFQQGFLLLSPATRKICGSVKGSKNGVEPFWKLAQWSTRFPLQGTPARRAEDDGGLVCEDETKYVEFGHEDGMLVLGLDSVREYEGHFRDGNQGWPHLLVQQDFRSPFLGRFQSLTLRFEARIIEAENIEDPDRGYDPGLHASQFQTFFIVKDDQPDSPGRGDFYWHGVPLYDSRKRFHQESLHVDFNPDLPEASRRCIFTPASRRYLGEGPSLHEGGWVRVEADLLPLIQEGLAKAKAQGALAQSPDTLGAYRIVHINIGWEIPGLAEVKGAIRGLSLVGEWKQIGD